eukprot:SAG11_NODE_40_length_21525_cov_16.276066_11_plen_232_part_00
MARERAQTIQFFVHLVLFRAGCRARYCYCAITVARRMSRVHDTPHSTKELTFSNLRIPMMSTVQTILYQIGMQAAVKKNGGYLQLVAAAFGGLVAWRHTAPSPQRTVAQSAVEAHGKVRAARRRGGRGGIIVVHALQRAESAVARPRRLCHRSSCRPPSRRGRLTQRPWLPEWQRLRPCFRNHASSLPMLTSAGACGNGSDLPKEPSSSNGHSRCINTTTSMLAQHSQPGP